MLSWGNGKWQGRRQRWNKILNSSWTQAGVKVFKRSSFLVNMPSLSIHWLRLLGLPLLFLLLRKDGYFGALILLVLLFLLDFVLQALSRKRPVGSFLEPFSEHLVLLCSLFLLSWKGQGGWWVGGFLVFRDVVLVIVYWLAAQDEIALLSEKWLENGVRYASSLYVLVLLASLSFPALSPAPLFLGMLAILLTLASLATSLFRYGYGLRRIIKGTPLKKERLVVLANQASSGYRDSYRRRLLQVFCRRRKAHLLFLPTQDNMFQGFDKKIEGYQHVVIAGGDGSFESALNYRPFRKKGLGFFPLGAGNFYYSYFYRGKRFEYLRSRFQFREALLDVLEVEWEGGKRETTLLSIGLDAEAMRLTKRTKQPGFSEYFMAGCKSILQAKAKWDVRCRGEGRELRLENMITLQLAKIPNWGFGLRGLLGSPEPANGQVYGLAVVNAHAPLWNKWVRGWALLFALFNVEKAPFLTLQGKEIRVESAEPFPLQAGGDFLGYTSWIRVKVVRKQKVLVI